MLEPTFASAPHDAVLLICSFLTLPDIGRAGQTCKDWCRILSKDPFIWKTLYLQRREVKTPLVREFLDWRYRVKYQAYIRLSRRVHDCDGQNYYILRDKAQKWFSNTKQSMLKLKEIEAKLAIRKQWIELRNDQRLCDPDFSSKEYQIDQFECRRLTRTIQRKKEDVRNSERRWRLFQRRLQDLKRLPQLKIQLQLNFTEFEEKAQARKEKRAQQLQHPMALARDGNSSMLTSAIAGAGAGAGAGGLTSGSWMTVGSSNEGLAGGASSSASASAGGAGASAGGASSSAGAGLLDSCLVGGGSR